MHFTEQFLLTTHVASQLTGRWFPAPEMKNFPHFNNPSPQSAKEWLDFIEQDLVSYRPVLPWLPVLLSSRRITLLHLCESIEKHLQETTDNGGKLIFMSSDSYPPLLRQIHRPPFCISILGDENLLTQKSIAVIGSRKASLESLKESFNLGKLLSLNGWSVISGGALGCDITVHHGVTSTRQAGQAGVIVFPGGLSQRFPKCNEKIFSAVLEQGGVLLSERLWFQDVRPRDFPIRNRIVSGMATATMVMCAAEKSGSMITAQEAMDQGRDLYIYDPGGYDIRFLGSKRLILDGAASFHSAEESLEMITLNYQEKELIEAISCKNNSDFVTVYGEKAMSTRGDL